MKKKIVALIFCVAAVILLAAAAIRPVIKGLIEASLRRTFIGSSVSIAGYSLNPFSSLELYAIRINNGELYNFSIGKIKIRYTPLSLIRKKIESIAVNDIDLNINIARSDKFDVSRYLRLEKKNVFVLKEIKLSGCRLKLSSDGLLLESDMAFDLDLESGVINHIYLGLPAFNFGQFKLVGLIFEAKNNSGQGRFFAQKISYAKINLGNLRADAVLSGKKLALENLSVDVLDGVVGGNAACVLTLPFSYAANFKASDINLAKLISDLDLMDRLMLEGVVSGDLRVEGEDADFNILDANFKSQGPGGRLTITDERILEAMAKNTGQALGFMVESFRDYRYNTAKAGLGIKDGDMILNVAMDSEAGKRDFDIVWHDFSIK